MNMAQRRMLEELKKIADAATGSDRHVLALVNNTLLDQERSIKKLKRELAACQERERNLIAS